jgi:uncharacterized membrane protein YdjX (TVP38/TMEM64 family)
MQQLALEWFSDHQAMAMAASVCLNVLIAISGVLPSAPLTAGNIIFFGFKAGLLISIIGEAAGAVASFWLYRLGIGKILSQKEVKNRFLQRLKQTRGAEAVLLVLLLRVLPFVPSGAVTLAAAYSQMSLLSFSIASTAGKIPSLVIEAYSVDRVLQLAIEWQIGIVLCAVLMLLVYKLVKQGGNKIQSKKPPSNK